MKHPEPARRAFTMLELLIVITIIAVLAALLMPALASARDRAKTAKCAHNQKQLAAAFTGYLNDNNGFYPYIYPACGVDNSPFGSPYSCTNGPDRHTFACFNGCGFGAYCYRSFGWNLVLAPYFGYDTNCFANWSFRSFCGQGGPACSACNFDPNIQRTVKAYGPQVQCPSNPWSIRVYCDPGYVAYPGVNPGVGWVQPVWRMLATSYAMNGNMFPADYRSGGVCTNNSGWNKRVNMADINNPSSVALLGEMPWCNWAVPNPPNVWGLTYLPGQMYMTAAVVSNTGAAYLWQKPSPSTYCNGYAAAWHGQSMNVLFPDGHVASIRQPDIYLYASQFTKAISGSPGSIFWGDGKSSAWYGGQFPGYTYPD